MLLDAIYNWATFSEFCHIYCHPLVHIWIYHNELRVFPSGLTTENTQVKMKNNIRKIWLSSVVCLRRWNNILVYKWSSNGPINERFVIHCLSLGYVVKHPTTGTYILFDVNSFLVKLSILITSKIQNLFSIKLIHCRKQHNNLPHSTSFLALAWRNIEWKFWLSQLLRFLSFLLATTAEKVEQIY